MNDKTRWLAWSVTLCLAGCDPASDAIEGVSAPAGFVVTHTDYVMAGAIALLDPDGALTKSRFVHSGTKFDGLGSALSADVVLPTQSGPAGVLTYLERLGTDLVTRIDIERGEVLGQLAAQSDDAGSYRANPYDLLYADDGAWIARNQPNLDVSSSDPDAGNDLIRIDLAKNALTSTRIGLSKLNTMAKITNPDTGETQDVVVYARPAGLVRIGAHAIVGLDRISLAYDAIGSGMVAVVDLETRSVEGLAIAGLSNCGTVLPVVDDDERVLVNCKGSFLADERDEAGYAIVRLEGDRARIELTWSAKKHADDPMATYSPVSLGGTRVVGVEPGAPTADPPTPDVAYVLDLESGEVDMLAEAGGAFVFGSGAYNADSRLLLLPDASTDEDGVPNAGVRRFRWDEDGEVTELKTVVSDPDLAPRAVAALR